MKRMYPCHFIRGSCPFSEKQEFEVNKDLSFSFKGIKYIKVPDETDKYRIRLIHKSDRKKFYELDTKSIVYKPKVESFGKLEESSTKGISAKELTVALGTTKEARRVINAEKNNVSSDVRFAVSTIIRKSNVAARDKLSHASSNVDESQTDMTVINVIESDGKIKLSKVAPSAMLKSLYGDAETLLKMEFKDIENLTGHEKFHTSVFLLLKHDFRIEKLKACLYLEYLIRLYQLTFKNIRSNQPLPGCPSVLSQFLLQNYTVQEYSADSKRIKRVYPKEEKDKLLMVILALFIYFHNYEVEVNALMTDLKISMERVKQIIKPFHGKVSTKTGNPEKGIGSKRIIASSSIKYMIVDAES